MESIKQWAVKYKQMFLLLGVIGMMLAPFLWPFFVAIVFQAFSVALPALIVGIAVKMIRREKSDEQKRNQGYKNTEDADVYSEETISGHKTSAGETSKKAEPVQERYWETGEKSLRKQLENKREMSDTSCFALVWYELEGKERIFRLIRKLETEGIHKFSISPEGVCSVRIENGYRRVGVLRSYPCRGMKELTPRLKKEHIHTLQKGKYLWLSWGKECFR
jgi:hypothetical protein